MICTQSPTRGNGNVYFTAMTFTRPGEYVYIIREDTPSGNGWTADKRMYPMHVRVADDGMGRLSAMVSYPGGYPEFVNYRYCEKLRSGARCVANTALSAKKPCQKPFSILPV